MTSPESKRRYWILSVKISAPAELRNPDLIGIAGRAWLSRCKPRIPDQTATLVSYVINRPGAHPFWSWWMLAVIHLRPIEGCRPAKKQYPAAEYELMIAALNPDQCPPNPDEGGYRFMTPLDVVEQFDGVSDRDACRVAEAGVRAILMGRLSPDQDDRAHWTAAIRGTVQHFKEGRHVEH